MIERNYKCDVCRETKVACELFGLHWDGKNWKERNPIESETHVCHWCANDIVSIRNNRETGVAIKEVKR